MILMIVVGFIVGAAGGSLFVVKEDGLAGGATVFVGGVIGAAVAIGSAILLLRKLSRNHLTRALILAGCVSLSLAAWIVYRIFSLQGS